MRILGIGEWCDLGSLYLRLKAEGHDVRAWIGNPLARGSLAGLVDRTHSVDAGLDWVRQAGQDGLVVFEDAKSGVWQDSLRSDGFHVVGGSALGARLETDRSFAQEQLRRIGLPTASTVGFTSYDQAIAHLRSVGGRWVYKYNGDRFPSTHTYVGELPDAADLIAVLEHHRDRWHWDDQPSFVLMQHIIGVEVGVGAWFDGTRFLDAICLDWEHKRFFPGDLGELTGEMGTLASYRGGERLFSHVLAPMTPLLHQSNYRGYINLNTMVNADGVWPLEFTCRFGYPGFSVLEVLQESSWGEILGQIAHGAGTSIRTRAGWSVAVVVTVPPFPNLRSEREPNDGLPVLFRRPLTPEDRRHLHFNELAIEGSRLVNRGIMGNLLVATGIGETVRVAQAQANERASIVVCPNARWRHDIGERFLASDHRRLVEWGWMDSSPSP